LPQRWIGWPHGLEGWPDLADAIPLFLPKYFPSTLLVVTDRAWIFAVKSSSSRRRLANGAVVD